MEENMRGIELGVYSYSVGTHMRLGIKVSPSPGLEGVLEVTTAPLGIV